MTDTSFPTPLASVRGGSPDPPCNGLDCREPRRVLRRRASTLRREARPGKTGRGTPCPRRSAAGQVEDSPWRETRRARLNCGIAFPLGLFAAFLALAAFPLLAAAATLKFDLVDKINWRADKAEVIGATVEETYAYEEASDTVTVTVRFDKKGFAPLPPMLAVALKYGFPAEFQTKPAETGAATAIGPLMGFDGTDGYTWKIKGLAKYVLHRPVLGSGKAPKELQDTLEAEVAKILSRGRLAPWLVLVNVPGSDPDGRGDVYWDSPAETLYLLAEAAPLLRPETAAALSQHLQAERTHSPPETLGTLPYAAGARREAFSPAPAILKRWEESVLGWRAKRPPGLWGLYGLARYAEAAGEKPSKEVMEKCREIVTQSLEHRDWATLYWRRGHTPEFNAVHGANRFFAGATAYIRLARMAGDRDAEALAWGLLARAAALRFAMGKYTQFMHDARLFNVNYDFQDDRAFKKFGPEALVIKVETDPAVSALPKDPAWWVKKRNNDWMGELVTWNWSRPIDNVRQVHRLDETGVDVWEWGGTDCHGTGQKRTVDRAKDYWYARLAPHLLPWPDMTPELGRFLADHLRPEMEAYANRLVENQPHWHAAYAEAILGAEIGFNLPADAYGHFLARAWILGEKPETLQTYIDVPWLPAGDLYHLHKVAETIKAYRGVTWEAARS